MGLGEATSFYRSNWGIADNYSEEYGRAIANVAYGYLESDAITVDHGEQYDVSAWIRGEIDADDSTGATDPAWLIRVLFYNSTGGSLGYVDADSGYPSEVSTTYDDKGGTVTAPTGSTSAERAATAKVQLYLFNAQGWVTYDDVTFEDVNYPGVNLVANPGFETSGGWTEVPHGALGEATNFYRGTSGLAAERSEAYGYAINNVAYGYARSDQFTVTGGTQYDVHAWVRGEIDAESSHGTNWIVKVRWYDDQGNALTPTTAASGSAAGVSTIWQQKGKTVTSPLNADKAAIDLYFSYGTGWVAYDDVTFVATAGGSNLAPDPGFEDGDGWTDKVWSVYGEATSHWRGDWGFGEPLSDDYSHVITNTAYGWLQSDSINVDEGATYDLNTWIRGRIDEDDSRDGTTWILRVNWYDTADDLIEYSIAKNGTATAIPTVWDEVGDEVTAPAGAVTAKIRIYLYMASGWINVDDVTFAKTAKETLYYSFGGETVGMRTGGELYWMITDHLGSTATVYKADGTKTPQHQYYHPWGNLRGSSEPVVPTDVGYTGQTHDQTTGLMHYNARYYDPTIGRFISADTIVPNPMNPQDLNRYTYVRNNPIRYNDPSGHSPPELQGLSGDPVQAECFSLGLGDLACSTQPWFPTQNPTIDGGDFAIVMIAIPFLGPASIVLSEVGYLPAAYCARFPKVCIGTGLAGEKVAKGVHKIGEKIADKLPFVSTNAAGDHLFLGLRNYGLRDLAAELGGQHLLDDPDWQATLMTAVTNPDTSFTVALDGFSGTGVYEQVMNAVQAGASISPAATQWEMMQLFNAGRLGDVVFMLNGQVVANPWSG